MIKIDDIYRKKLSTRQIKAIAKRIAADKKHMRIFEKLLLPAEFAKVKKAV